MPSVTGTSISNGAFALLGLYSPAETPSSADGTYALTVINDLLSEWSLGRAFVPIIARERFDMIADRGGPTNPYTIGSGGTLATTRPATQSAIVAANLILTDTDPEVRVPLGIYTDEAYFFNQIPAMSNTQPTSLYYNPTYSSSLGSVYLWPVPDNADNDLELLLQKPIAQFADLSTAYIVPDGLPRALKYNVAFTMGGTYGRQLAPSDAMIAVSSLERFKRGNLHLSDQMNDATWAGYRRTLYNINSGNG